MTFLIQSYQSGLFTYILSQIFLIYHQKLLKSDVRGSLRFGSNVQRTLRTYEGHKIPHFLPNLTRLLGTIINENAL